MESRLCHVLFIVRRHPLPLARIVKVEPVWLRPRLRLGTLLDHDIAQRLGLAP